MGCTRLYKHGRVAGLDGRIAFIIFNSLSDCSACAGGCGFSQIARITGAGRQGVLQVDVGLQSGLVIGDAVQVGINARRLLQLVFVTYFLPLIGMVTGAVSATILLPATGDIGALTGAVIGGLVIGGPLMVLSGSGHSLDWLGARVTRLA